MGPLSTRASKASRWWALSLQTFPGALPSTRASGPWALKRTTQSRTVCSPTAAQPRRPAPLWSACRRRRSRPAPAAAGFAQHCGSLWPRPAAGPRHSLCEARSLGAWRTSWSPAWNQTCARLKTPNELAFTPLGITPAALLTNSRATPLAACENSNTIFLLQCGR